MNFGHYFYTLPIDYVAYSHENKKIDTQELEKNNKFFTQDYILKLRQNGEACIHLIASGNLIDNYYKRVNTFDWDTFYTTLKGNFYIEFLKIKLKELNYDYIFIDSRTGVNDYSGICNIQMADMNVLIMAPNKQNFQGLMQMAKTIQNSPYTTNYRKPFILPILSRIDTGSQFFSKYKNEFKEEFKKILEPIYEFADFRPGTGDYFDLSRLDYTYSISSCENLLFGMEFTSGIELTTRYQYIATLINDFNNIIYANLKTYAGKILLRARPIHELYELAIKYKNEYKYELAIDIYNQIIKRASKEYSAYNYLGDIYSELGKLELALENYQCFNEIMKELINQNKIDEKIKNDLENSYVKLGEIYEKLENIELSKQNFAHAPFYQQQQEIIQKIK